MKHRKLLPCLAACAALCLTLGSCQLSKILPNDPSGALQPIGGTKTTASTTASGTSASPDAVQAMDLGNMDLTPYVTLGQYKGLPITIADTTVSEETLNTELDAYIQSCTYYDPITDRATQKGDTINMDYVGTMDGVAFQGGTAQGQTIELSESSGYIDGFADGLIGVMPGTTVTLNLKFPDNYGKADLAGKPCVFTVTVNYILGELIPPELTDEFITSLTGGAYTTVADFRSYYRSHLEAQAIQNAQDAAAEDLWETVRANATVKEVPKQQIDYYYSQILLSYSSYAASYGMDVPTLLSAMGITEAQIREEAQQYAAEDLIFYAVAQAEGMTVTDEEYSESVANIAQFNGATTEQIEAYYGKDYLYQSVLYSKCTSFLLKNAVIQ